MPLLKERNLKDLYRTAYLELRDFAQLSNAQFAQPEPVHALRLVAFLVDPIRLASCMTCSGGACDLH